MIRLALGLYFVWLGIIIFTAVEVWHFLVYYW